MELRYGFFSLVATLTCLTITFAGCSDDSKPSESSPDSDARIDAADETDAIETSDSPVETDATDEVTETDGTDTSDTSLRRCDPLDPSRCALPWPSNLYQQKDGETATGYNLEFGPKTLPVNSAGKHADPGPYTRLDGYGLGTPIMVAFDNLDASELPDQSEIADSMAEDASILLFEVDGDSVERIPYWTEIDANADESADKKMLLVRPAVQLDENTRYVVALRDLQRQDGTKIQPSDAFRKLRDSDTAGTNLQSRQQRFDEVFEILADRDIRAEELTLAWDFHTASCDTLHGPMLHIRDRAFELVGTKGPEIAIDSVEKFSATKEGENEFDKHTALEIQGTFRVPRFVRKTSYNGSDFWIFGRQNRSKPTQNGWKTSKFWVTVPHTAIDSAESTDDDNPAPGLVQYGHGLLGSGKRAQAGFNQRIAQKHNLIYFGSSLWGMSEQDKAAAVAALTDITRFRFMADRLHQGILEYLLLARAMQQRLAQTDVFERHDIGIDQGELFYSGISQGGIFGHTYMALSTDVKRGHLGVPGNNYSTLLERSVDFDKYFKILRNSYSNRLDQLIAIATMQLIWEQTEPVSYLHHIKKQPLPNTPSHEVLLAPAKGDYQVSVLTNEVAARSDLGIQLLENYGRSVDLVEPTSYPHDGSGVVLYDFGNPWPSKGNHPPSDELGDPHEWPRREPLHNEQMVHFFRTGKIKRVCTTYRDREPVCD